ncbi:MAG: DUF294 nucleotidyltransferase-like domain-containing protein [Desulfotalea sp.]
MSVHDLSGAVHCVTPNVAIEFFQGILPFKDLDHEVLVRLASHCRIDFFPKGTRLLTIDKTEISHLYLIQRGGVKAFINDDDGNLALKDFRGVGAHIGALGIIRGTKANLNIETVEDTFCFLLPRKAFLELVSTYPAVANYYLKSFSDKIVKTAYNELRRQKMRSRTNDDLYLFSITASDIVKELHAISSDSSVQEAAQKMAKDGVGSLLIFAPEEPGEFIGIITDTDLRKKVVAVGLDYREPVSMIMSGPLLTVLSQAVCFDVLLKMMSTGIHHLGVERGGRVVGVVTSHDIMLLQGNSPYYLFKEIIAQREIRGLYHLAQKFPEIIRNLIKEGGKAGNITRMIAILNDHILKQMLQLLEKEMGPPPVSYCWLLMGSEGRREQTFKTDQDNAIVYADPKNKQQAEQAAIYFQEFSKRAIHHLVNCGYPLCPGEIMATNPKWCQPISVWKEYFKRWIENPDPTELLHATIFFDFRSGYGNDSLALGLRKYLNKIAEKQTIFTFHLGRQCVVNRAPLSFFNNIVVEKNGEHKNQLNIKKRGLVPFVDFARVLSLKYGVSETNTLARFEALVKEGYIQEDLYAATVEAYELQMQLRLVHQLQQIEKGVLPDNYIQPVHLTELEQRMLKDAFGVIERIHSVLDQLFPVV